MSEYGLYDSSETVMYLYPLGASLATENESVLSNSQEEEEVLPAQEEEEEEEEEVRYTIDDIYAQMLSIRSKLVSETAVEESIEIRLQRIETYISVSVTLQCFMIGIIIGFLFLGRLR